MGLEALAKVLEYAALLVGIGASTTRWLLQSLSGRDGQDRGRGNNDLPVQPLLPIQRMRPSPRGELKLQDTSRSICATWGPSA